MTIKVTATVMATGKVTVTVTVTVTVKTMHFILQWVLIIITMLFGTINSYKLLVISPLPFKSHSILGEAMVEHLTNAGHEVTYVTVFLPEKPMPRVTVVDMSDNIKLFPSGPMSIQAVMDKTNEGNSFFAIVPQLMNMSKDTIAHPNVQKLINDKNQQFDAVIAEWMLNEVYAGFAGVFNCPLIWFSTLEPHWMVLRLVDEVTNPAYTVDVASDAVPPLTFIQRAEELGIQIVGRLSQALWVSRLENSLYDEFFVTAIKKRHNTAPSFEALRFNASLLLTNSHVSMGVPAVLPANVIPIGGYHIKPNVKPLPEDLQKLMDNAKHGVIYFSMGSNLRSNQLPEVVKQELLKMFGKLKQTVIWKFEEDLPNRPSNVHIVQWAPQQSILAHKNCILFITHGGLLSTTETMHFGVPIIGIPVFADQFVNVAKAVKKGYAQKVDLSYSMAADIELAIIKLLDDSSYTKRVKELSQIYHDRPVPPARELVHWVEHVVKTRGAPHLRSPAFMVAWYQKLYLDLVLVLVVLVLVLKRFFKYLKSILIAKQKEKTSYRYSSQIAALALSQCIVLLADKMFKKTQWLTLVLFTLCEINAYKYLVVSPIPGKSHSILGDAIVEHLAKAGHEVTYITAFTPEKVSPRVTIIDTDNYKNFPPDVGFNLNSFMNGTVTTNNFMTFAPFMLSVSRATLGNSNVRKLLADKNQQFDAVIAEWMFNEVYAGFSAVFNCPLIWFSSLEPHWMVMQLIDEIPNPAYSTDMLTTDGIPPLTFRQRVVELYTQIVGRLIQTFWLSGLEHDIYNEYFVPFIRDRYNTVPPFEELRYNASLMLSNSHISMNTPIRLPANVITIGGYHIKPNIKPLPEDLQKLMDNAKDGVIYFSMGSTLSSKHFPDEIKQDLLKMFGKLKQTVIWKFEEDLPNRPNNVHIVQWAPQQSILAHKNCIVFITHGGLLSTTETVHFGVPIIGVPVFADQFVNVGRTVKKGFAQTVDLNYALAASLEKAIRNVLDNPSYTTRVKELSAIYHDRTVPPATELVHWAEQVVKTKGARHLRSPAFMMPWYQKIYLDLILVLLVVLLVLKYVFIFIRNNFVVSNRKLKVN
ncbi:uncharacterized protein LOC112049418 [Bicyclus anynana]|uniref:Uncharacterized protein LOC112049418 n=1 Tax=Bicyclus anynana TaxID=110368 RepID=A0ABM3LYV5_BICAN|nr:uncharacterized protein LOC112049418 [Bicyclus anynana]